MYKNESKQHVKSIVIINDTHDNNDINDIDYDVTARNFAIIYYSFIISTNSHKFESSRPNILWDLQWKL